MNVMPIFSDSKTARTSVENPQNRAKFSLSSPFNQDYKKFTCHFSDQDAKNVIYFESIDFRLYSHDNEEVWMSDAEVKISSMLTKPIALDEHALNLKNLDKLIDKCKRITKKNQLIHPSVTEANSNYVGLEIMGADQESFFIVFKIPPQQWSDASLVTQAIKEELISKQFDRRSLLRMMDFINAIPNQSTKETLKPLSISYQMIIDLQACFIQSTKANLLLQFNRALISSQAPVTQRSIFAKSDDIDFINAIAYKIKLQLLYSEVISIDKFLGDLVRLMDKNYKTAFESYKQFFTNYISSVPTKTAVLAIEKIKYTNKPVSDFMKALLEMKNTTNKPTVIPQLI